MQYNAPLFAYLSQLEGIDVRVFYTWGSEASGGVYDRGFGLERIWDIPLLSGYAYEFVPNTSSRPGSNHFRGIVNPSLIERIRAYNPDMLLVFGWRFQSHLRVLRYFHGRVPILFRGDSTLLDEWGQPFLKKWLRCLFLKWVYRHVDYALYAGKANHAYFTKLGLREAQLVFAPHAVDNDRFSDKNGDYEKKARSWRAELGIGEKELVFLFAGKLEPKKDPVLLAVAFLALNAPGSRLIFVGNGLLEASLQEKTGKDKRILYIPFQNQSLMPVVYRLGDVFVLPSKGPGETWGLAVNEAMASGRAVVVSDRCGCAADLVQEGANGYVFRAGDAGGLLAILQTLYTERERLGTMGKRSEAIVKDWNYGTIAEAVERLASPLALPGR